MPYIQVKDLEMFYEKMGNGESVIFLHSGYSRGILAFASQMLDFQRKFTCYFPDFRGHGRTRCESLAWSSPQLADDMVEFMNQLNISKAHLISYSLGSNVGFYMAVHHPERVATLTTIGTGGFCDPTGVEEFEPEWLIQTEKHDFINQMIERHGEAHRGNWQAYMRQSAIDWRLYPSLTEEQISSIRCPALFITGEHDPFAGEERVKQLSSLVNQSRYLVVPGGSHRPHMLRESPILVNDSILEFVGSNPIEISGMSRTVDDKIFLLTGKPGLGKTTLIKKIINEIGADNCGGFYTEEIRDGDIRIGFTCVSLDGERQELANVNSSSSIRMGRYGIDISNFENVILKSVQDSLKSKKITIIDEVGFMQMLSIPFQQLMYSIVSENSSIILGTVPLDSHPEIDTLKRLPGVKIIRLNEENRDGIAEFVVEDILKVVSDL